VVDGVWLLLGIGVLVYYRAIGREDWAGDPARPSARARPSSSGRSATRRSATR
jgi:hypothetical protein